MPFTSPNHASPWYRDNQGRLTGHFPCNICGQDYPRIDIVTKHKAEQHGIFELVVPWIPAQSLNPSSDPKKAARDSRGRLFGLFFCDFCGLDFSREDTVVKHKSKQHDFGAPIYQGTNLPYSTYCKASATAIAPAEHKNGKHFVPEDDSLFVSPKPSPLPFASPIPNNPNLGTHDFSEPTVERNESGVYHRNRVDWPAIEDSHNRISPPSQVFPSNSIFQEHKRTDDHGAVQKPKLSRKGRRTTCRPSIDMDGNPVQIRKGRVYGRFSCSTCGKVETRFDQMTTHKRKKHGIFAPNSVLRKATSANTNITPRDSEHVGTPVDQLCPGYGNQAELQDQSRTHHDKNAESENGPGYKPDFSVNS